MDVRLRKRQMNDHICNYSSSGKCHCLAYASKHGIGLLVPEGFPSLYFACLFGGEGDESPSQIFFLSIPAIPYSNGQHQHFRDTNWKHWRQTSVAFWKVIISNSNDFSQKKKKPKQLYGYEHNMYSGFLCHTPMNLSWNCEQKHILLFLV